MVSSDVWELATSSYMYTWLFNEENRSLSYDFPKMQQWNAFTSNLFPSKIKGEISKEME